MINIGDTVKVISSTSFNEEQVCFYPIGTICRVIEKDSDGALGIIPVGTEGCYPYFYLDKELNTLQRKGGERDVVQRESDWNLPELR